MSAVTAIRAGDPIGAALAADPDGVLERIAETASVAMREVLDRLGAPQAVRIEGTLFQEVWAELAGWGPIMFIVHTRDGVFETKGSLPHGTLARGYFNVHGDSPIGGHLRADRCAAIYLVDRPFFKRRSCSVQFVSVDGDVMFKVFVARDAERNLDPKQLAAFETLRRAHAQAAG